MSSIRLLGQSRSPHIPVAEMTETDAAAFLQSPPKRTKQRTKPGNKVPIKTLIERAQANTTGVRIPLQRMNMVLALPGVDKSVALRLPEDQERVLCCAIITQDNSQAQELHPTPS